MTTFCHCRAIHKQYQSFITVELHTNNINLLSLYGTVHIFYRRLLKKSRLIYSEHLHTVSHSHTHVHTHTHTHIAHTQACTHTHTHTHTHMHASTHAHTHAQTTVHFSSDTHAQTPTLHAVATFTAPEPTWHGYSHTHSHCGIFTNLAQ